MLLHLILLLSFGIIVSNAETNSYPKIDWSKVRSIWEHPKVQPIFEQIKSQMNKSAVEIKNFTNIITGGDFAKAGQFPHHVTLFYNHESGSHYICGGSLIHPKWVLTVRF
jgi:hypothetical protein